MGISCQTSAHREMGLTSAVGYILQHRGHHQRDTEVHHLQWYSEVSMRPRADWTTAHLPSWWMRPKQCLGHERTSA